jgi:hypothetical protein
VVLVVLAEEARVEAAGLGQLGLGGDLVDAAIELLTPRQIGDRSVACLQVVTVGSILVFRSRSLSKLQGQEQQGAPSSHPRRSASTRVGEFSTSLPLADTPAPSRSGMSISSRIAQIASARSGPKILISGTNS